MEAYETSLRYQHSSRFLKKLVADRESHPTLRLFKPALSYVSYSAIKNGSNARHCPGDLPLIKRMLYSLSYIGDWLTRMVSPQSFGPCFVRLGPHLSNVKHYFS